MLFYLLGFMRFDRNHTTPVTNLPTALNGFHHTCHVVSGDRIRASWQIMLAWVRPLAAAAAVGTAYGGSGGSSPPPHLIFVLTDDLGWNSVYNNNRTITPFIDELAHQEGLKLTEHYT